MKLLKVAKQKQTVYNCMYVMQFCKFCNMNTKWQKSNLCIIVYNVDEVYMNII